MSSKSWTKRLPAMSQEAIVFLIFLVLFCIFSVSLNGFLTFSNVVSLLQNVAILGILGLAMGLVIISRGIDLSIVATMVMTTAWSVVLLNAGYSGVIAFGAGFLLALVFGAIQGLLIAYAEIPAIFATLAMGISIYGFGRIALVDGDIAHLSVDVGPLRALGNGSILGVPTPVIMFTITAALLYGLLRYTKVGVFIRCMGDNVQRARISGIAVRPLMVLEYIMSSGIGFLAGVIMAMLVGSVNTRIANSTMVYDVILVVVLGGIGLNGGKGGVRNVIVGTLLIGTLLNGMTILNVPYNIQNIIKGIVLLIAITADSILNPRDEQTSQQGDI